MAKIIVGPVDPELLEPEILPVVVVDPVRARLKDVFTELIRYYPDDADGNRHAATIPLTVANELVAVEAFGKDPQWRAFRASIDENINFRSFEIGVEYVRSIIKSL